MMPASQIEAASIKGTHHSVLFNSFMKIMTFFFNAQKSFLKIVSQNENTAHLDAKYRNMRFEAKILRKTMV